MSQCNHQPKNQNYAPCTREAGHDGPCAHPFSPEREIAILNAHLDDIRRMQRNYDDYLRRVVERADKHAISLAAVWTAIAILAVAVGGWLFGAI